MILIHFSYLSFIYVVISVVECGFFGRSQSSGMQSRSSYTAGATNNNYNSKNIDNNYNRGNVVYYNQFDNNQSVANKNISRSGSGLSAWGLIVLIMLIIMIGMGSYYGFICYPLICKEERNYDIMDAASTTASANTPTRSGDFEKSGNYSSRSTTPSGIINT